MGHFAVLAQKSMFHNKKIAKSDNCGALVFPLLTRFVFALEARFQVLRFLGVGVLGGRGREVFFGVFFVLRRGGEEFCGV